MIQNLLWATGYNALAIPLATSILCGVGILLTPAIGTVLMSLSTLIVSINARLLSLGGGQFKIAFNVKQVHGATSFQVTMFKCLRDVGVGVIASFGYKLQLLESFT